MLSVGRRAFQHERGLAGVIEDQARKDERRPGQADRPGAEMAHVGIKRLGAGHAQEDAAEHQKARQPAREQIGESRARGSSAQQHRGMLHDSPKPEQRR